MRNAYYVMYNLKFFSAYEDPPGIDSDSDLEDEEIASISESEEEHEARPSSRKWTRESSQERFIPPDAPFDTIHPKFNSHIDQLDSRSTHFNIFRKFIDFIIVGEILRQTNLHAQQIQRANPRAIPKWTDLEEPELWVFLALHLLTGIIKQPRLRDYWTTNENTQTPGFPKRMSRNKFENILRCLHFTNNEDPPMESDRLWKLGIILPQIMNNFRRCINPGEYLCVDESLMAFKGRLSFLQYNPLKRSRFGVKYFALVDCETKFLVKIIVYLGKKTRIDPKMKERCGIGGATVIQLLKGYLGKNHKVVLDNWFNSPKLQEHLATRKTFCLGTVRPNRKDMPKVTKKKLPKGAVESYVSNELLYEKWIDRRQVNMLTSFVPHDMEYVPSLNPNNNREKPASVVLYNKTMGGVDYIDQVLSPYKAERKTIRWYKKFFFHLIDLSVYNSFVVYKNLNPTKRVVYLDFLQDLVAEILDKNHVKRKIGRPLRTINHNMENMSGHLPEKVLKANGKSSYSDCYVCRQSGKRKTTLFKCGPCNKRLCIGSSESCYTKFHRNRDTYAVTDLNQTSVNHSENRTPASEESDESQSQSLLQESLSQSSFQESQSQSQSLLSSQYAFQ